MSIPTSDTPAVLSFVSHDPTGGEGLQADIEALGAIGCHSTQVITALTVQDTLNLKHIYPSSSQLITEQARTVLEDIPVHAIKLGIIPTLEAIQAIHQIISDYPDLPVVYDPHFEALHHKNWLHSELSDAIRLLILPLVTVCHLTVDEAKLLAPFDTIDTAAHEFMGYGVEYLLVRRVKLDSQYIYNNVYGNHRLLEQYRFPQLPYEYHGVRSTLSASMTGFLAQGLDAFSAIHQAQEFTYSAMKGASRLGMGKLVPNRLFWTKTEKA